MAARTTRAGAASSLKSAEPATAPTMSPTRPKAAARPARRGAAAGPVEGVAPGLLRFGEDGGRLAGVPQASPRVPLQAAAQQAPYRLGRRCRQGFVVHVGPQHRRQRVGDGLAAERPVTGEHLVESHAEGPEVGALVGDLAAGLFRAHVRGGSEDHPGRRCPSEVRVGEIDGSLPLDDASGGPRRHLREPEVQHLDRCRSPWHHDVRRVSGRGARHHLARAAASSAAGDLAVRAFSASIAPATDHAGEALGRDPRRGGQLHGEELDLALIRVQAVNRRRRARMVQRGQDAALPVRTGQVRSASRGECVRW